MDSELTQQLAELPPVQWAEAQRRHRILSRYLAEPDRTTAVADRYAKEMGVGRSLLYSLARILSERRDGRSTRIFVRSSAAAVDAGSAAAVTDAMGALGAGARPTEVFAEARRLCIERGVPLPSKRQIRTRHVRPGAGKEAAARLRVDADVALDAGMLALSIDDHLEPKIAHLVTLLDLREGSVLDYLVTAGVPTFRDALTLLNRMPVTEDRVKLVLPIERLTGPLRQDLAGRRSIRIIKVRRLSPGSAVRAVLGDRLGRIPLLRRSPSASAIKATSNLQTVSAVVARLIDERIPKETNKEPGQPLESPRAT